MQNFWREGGIEFHGSDEEYLFNASLTTAVIWGCMNGKKGAKYLRLRARAMFSPPFSFLYALRKASATSCIPFARFGFPPLSELSFFSCSRRVAEKYKNSARSQASSPPSTVCSKSRSSISPLV